MQFREFTKDEIDKDRGNPNEESKNRVESDGEW